MQHVLFDVDALVGELTLGRHLAAQGVQSVQESNREGRAGAHTASRRQVAVVMQLDAALDFEEAERLPNRGVADLLDRGAGFDLAVNDADGMLEEGGQIAAGQITILIDGGRQHRPAMSAIPTRIIGTATEEGDPERCSTDDHSVDLIGVVIHHRRRTHRPRRLLSA